MINHEDDRVEKNTWFCEHCKSSKIAVICALVMILATKTSARLPEVVCPRQWGEERGRGRRGTVFISLTGVCVWGKEGKGSGWWVQAGRYLAVSVTQETKCEHNKRPGDKEDASIMWWRGGSYTWLQHFRHLLRSCRPLLPTLTWPLEYGCQYRPNYERPWY